MFIVIVLIHLPFMLQQLVVLRVRYYLVMVVLLLLGPHSLL
uniref:Uncharacterized protein n=1 Tax=virus sp. ctML55 TaxID=2827627 RepID=A0A8S5RI18_9VIRU|nr:MAG TPA: hypothetical protein [virus sp. ctML55]